MNCLMLPLNLALIAETIVQHWDPPITLIGKLLAIAATAIAQNAALWTLNRADFADIPGLRLL